MLSWHMIYQGPNTLGTSQSDHISSEAIQFTQSPIVYIFKYLDVIPKLPWQTHPLNLGKKKKLNSQHLVMML